MNRNAVQEPEAAVCDACQLVPLSALSLDYAEPIGGWEAMLRGRGVELTEDDLGRPAISREDARTLIEERRQWGIDHAEQVARQQAEMARKARPIPAGIPFPEEGDPSMSPYEVMRAVDEEAEQSDPTRRLTPTEEFLAERLGQPRKVVTEEK